ncbi:VWA domain-containing protein [Aeoliella mucimassa]|uniref:VWFA domain-containing protein n=1 Tax=Aeoliella mucimassa TaxID=2527972 RepID=A0A518AP82_9BACT|nr:vWA domain-containing protein [Aeoliella mucimassa]QDU56536.1 hypothetical protein Pan181_27460 [Aeoliella mucimassa]
MVAVLAAFIALAITLLAEALHWRRMHRIAHLAFGPEARPRMWVRVAPFVLAAAVAACVWGLTTLLLIEPKVHTSTKIAESELKHLVLVLDVSPSMRLVDAGPEGDISRQQQVHRLMNSFFERVQLPNYRTSVVAVYNGAKPVVIDTKDRQVVDNILDDLPLHLAFNIGKTDLFAGLGEAADIVADFPPRSTTLLLLSDGDTVPATGMPEMPKSVEHVVVVGVGDPVAGKFIDGRQSRQDASTLRQIAVRLGGVYHDGNQKHLSTSLIRSIAATDAVSTLEKLTLREFALIASATGAVAISVIPLLLHYFGSGWQPGVRYSNTVSRERKRVTSQKFNRHAPKAALQSKASPSVTSAPS